MQPPLAHALSTAYARFMLRRKRMFVVSNDSFVNSDPTLYASMNHLFCCEIFNQDFDVGDASPIIIDWKQENENHLLH